MGKPLGPRQLEFLAAHRFPNSFRFKPTRTGRPHPVMLSLVRRELIWIERRHVAYWRPWFNEWDDRNKANWIFGLTPEGQVVADRERPAQE